VLIKELIKMNNVSPHPSSRFEFYSGFKFQVSRRLASFSALGVEVRGERAVPVLRFLFTSLWPFRNFTFPLSVFHFPLCLLVLLLPLLCPAADVAPVTVHEDRTGFTLANGIVSARVDKANGHLVSLIYQGQELFGHGGGYWSFVGRVNESMWGQGYLRVNPATNGGTRAEVVCQFPVDPNDPPQNLAMEYRYALGAGDSGIYATAVFHHEPGHAAFGAAEGRYALKLNPEIFDYLSVDARRQRVMPSGYDWDHGAALNLKEARRMTTGVHKGEVEHKYDYSAVFSETPAYGWSSTRQHLGLWVVNPSLEYLGGGPTKAELTGHLDVNAGGLPTLLNMWLGSHYGGTSLYAAPGEAWTKVVGPFLIYCNSRPTPEALWRDALAQAARETARWPYAWATDTNYPSAAQRAMVSGQLVLRDPQDHAAAMSNLWVGVTAPDYFVPGSRRSAQSTRVDWQRDAKFYEFWSRADGQGHFTLPNVRAGHYTLHAIADGVLGEFTLTNILVAAGQSLDLGGLSWSPVHFGRTVWQIGVPDRTAQEFHHGDDYWHWGLYFDYPREFPNDVNFLIGQSDWRRDWNYVQPPRLESRDLPVVGEDEEQREDATAALARSRGAEIHSTPWTIRFPLPTAAHGRATLRLAFCGTHLGCNVEVLVNGQSVGETGILPSTSAMQRDGIRAYWIEKDIPFDARLLKTGENVIQLLSHAHSWSQGVMYDCLRLELDDSANPLTVKP